VKANLIPTPVEYALESHSLIKKQPSAELKPAIHCCAIKLGDKTSTLAAGITEVKEFFKLSDNLKFIEALILTNFWIPSLVKCSLFFTNSKACLNKIKSAYFLVING